MILYVDLFCDGSSYLKMPKKKEPTGKIVVTGSYVFDPYRNIFRLEETKPKPMVPEIRVAAYAYSIYMNDQLVVLDGHYTNPGTNQSTEIKAILNGLRRLRKIIKVGRLKDKYEKYCVRIHSDSFTACDNCRTNIYRWLKKERNGVLYNSVGEPVSHQQVYREIHDDFLTHEKYDIQFLHINSHIIDRVMFEDEVSEYRTYLENRLTNPELKPTFNESLFKDKKFIKGKETFLSKNGIVIDDYSFLRLLAYNQIVDNKARAFLDEGMEKDKIYRK